MKLRIAVCFCVSPLLMVLSPARAKAQPISPSFDCARASEEDELAICSSRKSTELDVVISIGNAWLQHRMGKNEVTRIGAPLLKERRACQSDLSCIDDRQLEFANVLETHGAPITLPKWAEAGGGAPEEQLPTIIGQCSRTTIDDIGGRLMSDSNFSSGTSVSFSNGGYQVSYESESAIISSHVGDPVTMCLESIPENCPPGDERGKIYKTTNDRTGLSWTLADSQHGCGGA